MLQLQLAEMGTEQGHCAQDELVTRLAAAVLAPWQQLPAQGASSSMASATPMEVDGQRRTQAKDDDGMDATAARRADVMFEFAWGWIFDKAATSPRDVDTKSVSPSVPNPISCLAHSPF